MTKKLFTPLLLAFILICSVAHAAYRQTSIFLNDSAGTKITDYSLTSGVAVYSQTINTERLAGFMSLFIIEDKAGGAGDVDISAEYSFDGSNFYTIYTTNMAGTITAEGNIATTLGNATRWIVFTPRVARFMRIKFDPDADSEITARIIYIEDI